MDRIIPAYAGSTIEAAYERGAAEGSSPHTRGAPIAAFVTDPPFWDHPRIRGEHRRHISWESQLMGIIPAYAGSTLPMVARQRPRHGIIPAYAGSTSISRLSIFTGLGSSPHTRGAPDRLSRFSFLPRDHPRIRGEHGVAPFVGTVETGIIPAYAGSTVRHVGDVTPEMGSSPHTRGAPTFPRALSCAA